VFFWKKRNTWAYESKTPEGKLRRTSHGTAEAAQTYCKQIQAEWLSADEKRSTRPARGAIWAAQKG